MIVNKNRIELNKTEDRRYNGWAKAVLTIMNHWRNQI